MPALLIRSIIHTMRNKSYTRQFSLSRLTLATLMGMLILPLWALAAYTRSDFFSPNLSDDQIKVIEDQLSKPGITDTQRQDLENQLAGRQLTPAEHTTLQNLLRQQQVDDQIAQLRILLAEVIRQIQEITGAITAAEIHCPIISYQLGKEGYKKDENTDGQVSELQRFLARYPDVYPEGLVTGFYGDATRRAVRRFKERFGIAGTTEEDYGNVGSDMRKKLAAICEPGKLLKTPAPGQEVRVISPNGEESWRRRDYHLIKWENKGGIEGTARIFLFNKRTSKQWIVGATSSLPGINEYTWFTAGGDVDNEEAQAQSNFLEADNNPPPADHDRIQVCIIEYAACDESDSDFRITTPTAVVSVQPRSGSNSGPSIDTAGMAAILIGKNIRYQAIESSDHSSVKFNDIPFGTYVLSVGAPGYRPAVNTHFRINAYTAPRDRDLDNKHHRISVIAMVPTDYEPPPIKLVTPVAGEPLIMGATTTIEWRAVDEIKNFNIELISQDESHTWLVGTTSNSTLNVGGDILNFKGKAIVWEIGKCAGGKVCNPPVTPGYYNIRVRSNYGDFDGLGLGQYVRLYPPNVGAPTIRISHAEIALNGNESVPIHLHYDPDGPGNPAGEVEITDFSKYYSWKSSNFSIVDRSFPDAGGIIFVGTGPGDATMTVRYRGAKAYVRVTVKGTRDIPLIDYISHSSFGDAPPLPIPPIVPDTSSDDALDATLPPEPMIAVGGRVAVTDGPVNVRASAEGVVLGTQTTGVRGTVVSGPVASGLYTWWNVNFDQGVDGWIATDFIIPAVRTGG